MPGASVCPRHFLWLLCALPLGAPLSQMLHLYGSVFLCDAIETATGQYHTAFNLSLALVTRRRLRPCWIFICFVYIVK